MLECSIERMFVSERTNVRVGRCFACKQAFSGVRPPVRRFPVRRARVLLPPSTPAARENRLRRGVHAVSAPP